MVERELQTRSQKRDEFISILDRFIAEAEMHGTSPICNSLRLVLAEISLAAKEYFESNDLRREEAFINRYEYLINFYNEMIKDQKHNLPIEDQAKFNNYIDEIHKAIHTELPHYVLLLIPRFNKEQAEVIKPAQQAIEPKQTKHVTHGKN